jgi:hypothetical protein
LTIPPVDENDDIRVQNKWIRRIESMHDEMDDNRHLPGGVGPDPTAGWDQSIREEVKNGDSVMKSHALSA